MVAHAGCEFFGRHFDFASAEALDVREAGVGADFDVVFLAELDGVLHY